MLAGIDDKLARIDTSQFDTEALLEKNAYDESEIIRFVQDGIAFEDYNGVLRGVKGTLRSRAGNSIDQALLLASLLKDIGADARIVEGTIARGELVKLLVQKRPEPTGVYGQLVAAQQAGNAAPPEAPFETPAEVAKMSSRLTQALQGHAPVFQAARELSGEAPVPYFWVEYRDSPASAWTGVHPVFPAGGGPVPAPAPGKYFADSIGDELQHRISVQAFIERSWNGKLETVAVTRPYDYPAANLSGRHFTYSVIPNTYLDSVAGNDREAEEMLAGATLFFPVFDFGSIRFDMAFDTAGNVLSAEDASSDKAAIFQTVGGKFGAVADMIAVDGESAPGGVKPQRHITRHWLEFTIAQPGQEPKVIVRDIARWDGGEDEFRQSLSRSAYFRVETGAVAPAEFLERNLRAMKKTVQLGRSPLSKKSLDDAALQFSLDAEVFLLTSDMVARRQSGVISYRDAPAIVARYRPYGREALDREGFDIISSPRRVVLASTGEISPAGAISSGVVDTWLEYKLFAGEKWLQDSAFEKLEQRMLADDSLTLLSSTAAGGVDKLPDPAREIIGREINNRQFVLYPGKAGQCDSWWQVDPSSGETIGMLDNGWGGASSEYINNLTIMYGKAKVATALLSCSTVIAFIRGSAVLSAWSVFQADEALGMGGMDLCSQLPSADLQALCTVVVASAAIAGESGLEAVGAETLKYMCLRAIFS